MYMRAPCCLVSFPSRTASVDYICEPFAPTYTRTFEKASRSNPFYVSAVFFLFFFFISLVLGRRRDGMINDKLPRRAHTNTKTTKSIEIPFVMYDAAAAVDIQYIIWCSPSAPSSLPAFTRHLQTKANEIMHLIYNKYTRKARIVEFIRQRLLMRLLRH